MSRKKPPLPPLALAYIAARKPTLKTTSWVALHYPLRQFHHWLDRQHLQLALLKRHHLELWFSALHDSGRTPASRLMLLLHVRAYLLWLADRRVLHHDPYDLIRNTDFPKRPQYLPRPLPPAIDQPLQTRLAQSDDPLWRGLAIMRQTGLRISELLSLPYDCVRDDSLGHRFLKVPLGKLNSERMVPLADHTYNLITLLQACDPQPRSRLLQTTEGKRIPYTHAAAALRLAGAGLCDPKELTSHRLRHTYATELLNAGMSLVGIMKLLGHRSYLMTLRYAAVSSGLIREEYFAAIGQLEQKYAIKPQNHPGEFDPNKAIYDLLAWIANNVGHSQHPRADRLARRLRRTLLRLLPQLQAFMPAPVLAKVTS